MSEEILRAESAIKAGDTRTGFEILRGFLAENPNSERAWWVMSGLVPSDQREHCLQQVLRVNPANQFAQEALEKLKEREQQIQPAPEPTPPTARQEPTPEPAPSAAQQQPVPSEDTQEEAYQAWHHVQRSAAYFTILANKGIIYAETEPRMVSQVQEAVQRGNLPDALVRATRAIPYQKITRVRQIVSSLRVYFKSVPKEGSLRLELPDSETADQVLAGLRGKLGPEFVLTSTPVKLGYSLILSALLLLGSVGLTILFLWGAVEVRTGQAAATGSIRARFTISLLEFLGPLGVGIIGGILILLSLIVSVRLILRSTNIIELSRPD
jgi:hypothetical protein